MIKKILLTPFQKFVKTGSTAGTLLFATTIIAIIWANTPYASAYEAVLQYKLGFSFEGFELTKPLILWINDGLMAIFFFLIGLELKRELLVGEINTLKKAALPVFAALGGVIVPISLYFILNDNPETIKGWGISMATDIAFALAILSLLGNKVPLSLKVFLTAFAIIDDIAAVIVIAVFYSSNVDVNLMFMGIGLVVLLGVFYKYVRYSFGIGMVVAVITWILFLKSGIHPTIAGVLLAFTIPLQRTLNIREFAYNLTSISDEIVKKSMDDDDDDSDKHILTEKEIECIDSLDEVTSEAISPLQKLEHKLHGLTAYFILPIFAFANAGVSLFTGYSYDTNLIFKIAVSLFVGKFVGVSLFSYIGVKLKITELPSDLTFKHVFGIAAIAGVGFTMAIFIDFLAFAGNDLYISSAKIGIIIGSLVSGIVGYTILRLAGKKA